MELARQAITERGAPVKHTDEEVDLALKLLAINGGAPEITAKQLGEEKVKVGRNTLVAWRDRLFARRYTEVRRSLGREISEQVAGRALERALQADAATDLYLQEAVNKLGEVEPNHIAKNVAALSQAKSNEIEKARLLRNEPDSIQETRTLEENIAVLERLGVAGRDDFETIEGTAVEE